MQDRQGLSTPGTQHINQQVQTSLEECKRKTFSSKEYKRGTANEK